MLPRQKVTQAKCYLQAKLNQANCDYKKKCGQAKDKSANFDKRENVADNQQQFKVIKSKMGGKRPGTWKPSPQYLL